MLDLFERLNERQIEAVCATEGYVRIIAGAGSGKTKTLTHRYAYLVKAAGIHPGNVLCVTFTSKAAGEMKRRVRSLIGDGYDNSLITTYHGFCVRVLREDIGRLFYPQNFAILDEWDQKKILEEIYTEMELKLDSVSFEKILEKIHAIKATDDYVDRFVTRDAPQTSSNYATLEDAIIDKYMAKQKRTFGLDFDDLISFTFALFDRFPEVKKRWQEQLHYIQVDEFQDSSARELRLIQTLSSEHANLFVVGDPDQNIYEWRGATMAILVDFDKMFPGTETIILNQNYRSTQNILNAANVLVKNNKNRLPKDLFTKGEKGSDVIHLHSKTEEDEGKWIAEEILRLVKHENHAYKDIALLYRSGFLSRFLEQALMTAAIPYELYGSLRFYDRMEIRDVIAYLKLIVYNDNAAFERVINTPRRSFGKAKMSRLKGLAIQNNMTYYETLQKYIDVPDFQRSGAETFLQIIESLRMRYREMPVSEVIQTVMIKSGYEQYIRENGSMERLDNLAEFKRTALEQERSYGEFFSLDDFLRQIMIEADREEAGEETDKVKLMTVHASKGLEFPVCFVSGMTDGIFPSGRTIEERKEAGLEEERRLCFVAITRAMKRLYLTESEGNTPAGQSSRKKIPSRFVFEIGSDNYTRVGVIPKEIEDEVRKNISRSAPPPIEALTAGDTVSHAIFGKGTVVSIDEGKRIYSILFEKSNSVKPVSMDYNFGAWQDIDKAREDALKEASVAKHEPSKNVQDVFKRIQDRNNDISLVTDEPPSGETPSDNPEPQDESADVAPKFDQLQLDIPDEVSLGSEIPADEPAPVEQTKPKQAEPREPRADIQNADWNQPPDGDEENLWKRSDVPHDGWTCVNVIDLGRPDGVCRMCGHQIIRYVHIMMHPQYPRAIGAGCVCAGKMEGSPEAAKEREKSLINRTSRKETFLKIPLKKSKNGNEYLKYKDEIITIIKDKFKQNQYKSVFRNNYSQPHPTKQEALLEAFNEIDNE